MKKVHVLVNVDGWIAWGLLCGELWCNTFTLHIHKVINVDSPLLEICFWPPPYYVHVLIANTGWGGWLNDFFCFFSSLLGRLPSKTFRKSVCRFGTRKGWTFSTLKVGNVGHPFIISFSVWWCVVASVSHLRFYLLCMFPSVLVCCNCQHLRLVVGSCTLVYLRCALPPLLCHIINFRFPSLSLVSFLAKYKSFILCVLLRSPRVYFLMFYSV